VPLAQPAQESLGQNDLVLLTERGDDVALLIGQMVTMSLPEVLDRHSPRPWTQRGLSWGWTAVLWLAYLRTEGDHRKVSVATSLQGRHHTLSRLTAQVIEPLDLSDERLSPLLHHVRQPAYGHQSERALKARSLEVHAWPQDVLRCDATTGSGDHEVTDGGLVQCGHSTADPTRPQIQGMLGSLAPLGMPLATAVWSGERAADGFYLPLIERMRSGWPTTGRLLVGDGKRRAWDPRASLARHQDWDLSPLPLTGAPAEAMDAWITAGVTQGEAGELGRRGRTHDRGHEGRAAEA
jgi:transposase